MWKENGGERDKAGNEGNENTVCGVTEGGYGVGSARGARGAERTRSRQSGRKRGTHVLKEDPTSRALLQCTHFGHRFGLPFTNRVSSFSGEILKIDLGKSTTVSSCQGELRVTKKRTHLWKRL